MDHLTELENTIETAGHAGDIAKLNETIDNLEIIKGGLRSEVRDPSITDEQAQQLIERIDALIGRAGTLASDPVVRTRNRLNEIENSIGRLGEQCQADSIDELRRELQTTQGVLESDEWRDPSISEEEAQELINRIRDLKQRARASARTCRARKVAHLGDDVIGKIGLLAGVSYCEENPCRDKQKAPNDPYFHSKGSWKQAYDDQWAIKHVGFTDKKGSAWDIEDGTTNPMVVAVIDTGLDWNHLDISRDNIWRNEDEIPDNGKDDDNNGYVDDVIGWNFIGNNNQPWDEDGHGTFVTGVIAAATNNGVGIAGINRGAKIMVLKSLNAFGHSRASFLAEAIFYAANNGARVINISAGGKRLTRTEQEAIDYAHAMGAVIVVSAGNEGVDTLDYSPSGLRNVVAVATTDNKDKRAGFSNWGQGIDIAAPGMDVLSLRARRTDLMLGIPGVTYTPKLAYVGKDTRYYRASGSSFSAPIVAATASLILAKDPTLTNTQVERMLLQSARDIEVQGWDQYTGFGLLDARAALMANPEYYLLAQIQQVQPVQEKGKMYLEVLGTVGSSDFKEATIDLGLGEEPKEWKKVAIVKKLVSEGRLGLISATEFTKVGKWTIRLQASDKKGKIRESRASVDIQ